MNEAKIDGCLNLIKASAPVASFTLSDVFAKVQEIAPRAKRNWRRPAFISGAVFVSLAIGLGTYFGIRSFRNPNGVPGEMPSSLETTIAEDWAKEKGTAFSYDYYYGSFDGGQIFLKESGDQVAKSSYEVAGYSFKMEEPFEITYWSSGYFVSLPSSYLSQNCSKDSLEKLAQIHRSYAKSRYHGTADFASWYSAAGSANTGITPEIDSELAKEILADYQASFYAKNKEWDPAVIDAYYGQYGEAHALLIRSYGTSFAQENVSQVVGGYTFDYSQHYLLSVYQSHSFYSLEDAFAKDILSEENLATLNSLYKERNS